MPRKFLKRYAPSPKTIREHKSLSFLGTALHNPSLWHMNRNSVARAFAIGLFCTWLPFPMQTIIAALLAIYYRANLPISVVLVYITNPVTIPPMFFFAYKLGSVMLGLEYEPIAMDMSWQWLSTTLGQIWQPLLFGCMILAIVSSASGYFIINTLWRKNIRHRWKERTAEREAKEAEEIILKSIKKAMKDS